MNKVEKLENISIKGFKGLTETYFINDEFYVNVYRYCNNDLVYKTYHPYNYGVYLIDDTINTLHKYIKIDDLSFLESLEFTESYWTSEDLGVINHDNYIKMCKKGIIRHQKINNFLTNE